jgi:DDE superfamily endonuclease
MEDVLEVYAEPYDPRRPKVNFDETSKQLIQETRQPLPAQPGRPQRYDYEYERNGTRNLFLFVEPQAGWRHVQVTKQRTKLDFAHAMQWLVDEGYPEATVIRVVLDKPTVSLGVTCAVVDTYGCDDGRIAPTRCAIIAAGLDGTESQCRACTTTSSRSRLSP